MFVADSPGSPVSTRVPGNLQRRSSWDNAGSNLDMESLMYFQFAEKKLSSTSH